MNPERVGRDGFLRLRFSCSGSRTILAESRFSLPLQALAPLALEDGSSYMMLLNPTGGVLGGDRLITQIVLDPATHACLTTPSATRVYRTDEHPAALETAIRVGERATLEFFPDHVIPHPGSALSQSLRVEMAPGSRSIILDAMASGRLARGERWAFREFDSRTEIYLCGKPAGINRARIMPAQMRPGRLGPMEDFGYMAGIFVVADGFEGWMEMCTVLNAILESMPEVRGGASLLARGGLTARFLARSAPTMTFVIKLLWDASRKLLLGLPPLDQRKY